MDTILTPLLNSPKLRIYLNSLQKAVEAEDAVRNKFYNDITEQDKAEFINGEVIFHSPVMWRHTVAGKLLLRCLDAYVDKHNLGAVGYEKTLISLTRNDYEPDICFFSKQKADKLHPKQMRFPAPDFVAEILSKSTEKNDRGIKMVDYAAHGVGEYWIIDPAKQTVEQYILNQDNYELKIKTDTGILKSTEIEGFEIFVQAVFNSEENLVALNQILNS